METLLPLAETAGRLLKSRGETIGIAESSAGGLISAALLAVGAIAALFIDTGKTVEMDEQRDADTLKGRGGDQVDTASLPPFAGAGFRVRLERHHLRRPLRWRRK